MRIALVGLLTVVIVGVVLYFLHVENPLSPWRHLLCVKLLCCILSHGY